MSCNKCKSSSCSCCSSAIRYTGPDVNCLGVSTNDTMDSIIEKVVKEICDLIDNQSSDNSIDHVSFSASTGIPNNIPNQAGELDTYFVYGDIAETIILGSFTVYNGFNGSDGADGADGSDGADGQGIDHTSFSSSSAVPNSVPNQPGATDTYTIWADAAELISLGTFTVYNGDDLISEYGNTVFVDAVYGDDSTGERERFSKPFLTYAGARAVANSGDSVIVRSGTYNETFELKDGVNIYFDSNVTINGTFIDNGNTLSANVHGRPNVNISGTSGISLTGPDTNIFMDLGNLFSPNTGIRVSVGVGNTANVTIKFNRMYGNLVNYFVTCEGDPKVIVIARESMETADNVTGPFSGINTSSFSGTLNVKCPYVYIGDSTATDNCRFYNEFPGTSLGKVFIEMDKVDILHTTPQVSPLAASIRKVTNTDLHIKVKRYKTISQTGMISQTDGGILLFEGSIECEQMPVVRIGDSGRVVIKNSYLSRTSGTNGNEVVALGDFGANISPIFGSNDDMQLEMINTQIHRTNSVAETAGSGAIITTEGTNSKVFLKDCDIVCESVGVGATAPIACDGPSTEGRFYFRNVHTNLATGLGTGVVQLQSSATEFTDNETELATYGYFS